MSDLRSFVERTVQVQSQHFTRLQTPVPFFAALVVFSSLPILRRTPMASASAVTATIGKALTKFRMPASLSSLFSIFAHAFNTACLRVRVYVDIPIRWRRVLGRIAGNVHRQADDRDTYATPRAQARYWRIADRYRRRLYSGNGTECISSSSVLRSTSPQNIPLVTYYTPRLLPLYRGNKNGKHVSHDSDVEASERRITPRTYCKWHRMVFYDADHHPTLAQAAVQMRYYSNRDLREMQRIARLLPDEQVFDPKERVSPKPKWSSRYREMWRNWLESKSMDLVIVFE